MMAVLVLLAPRLPGQAPAARDPHIGYVFPAGAQRGSSVEVLIGGQVLRNATQVVFSGADVTARVLKVYRPVRNFDKEQREEIQRQIAARRAVLAGQPVPPVKPRPADAPAFVMPELYWLDRLARADAAEFEHLVAVFHRTTKKQMNTQLGEMVSLEVTVAPGAAPGARELRLLTAAGLTNPLRFDVGAFGELCEREPNEPTPKPGPPPPQVAGLPVVFNGQVLPGDVDRLRFHARGGQPLVVEVQARSLIPYLADAVPGWFQPVLAVFDAQGKELAYADDFRFRPDPVLLFRVPAEGDYAVEVRDSLFRGREDFVYRIKVSEQPFVTACFPLGAAAGSTATGRLTGWNLPRTDVVLDTRPGGGAMRELSVTGHGMASNPVTYAVDELPDAAESEPNNDRKSARVVPWPCVVNGRINQPGDVDVFRLAAPGGAALVVEVQARRLGSSLDSVVRVTDAEGKVLEWNDDSMPKDGQLQLGDGLLTHHADSRLAVTLPANGPVFVQIEDAQHQGGEAYGYRLRIAPAQPDFALRLTPSALNLVPGQATPVTVHVERRDGFTGAVTLGLEAMAAGWGMAGNVIPSGHEHLRLTVQAPADAAAGVQALHLTGKARIGGVEVSRPVEACDDTMQAFLWRHLVPARECLAAVLASKQRVPLVQRIGEGMVEVPAGGETVLTFRTQGWVARRGIEVVTVEAPDGLGVRSEVTAAGEIAVHLTADAALLKPGYTDNLILGVLMQPPPLATKAKKPARQIRTGTPVAALPAISLTIKPQPPKP